jgi:LPXTG-motif cell wall-anchored protein
VTVSDGFNTAFAQTKPFEVPEQATRGGGRGVPWWIYVLAGLALILVVAGVVFVRRRRVAA